MNQDGLGFISPDAGRVEGQPDPRGERMPLSLSQQLLWLLDHLYPGEVLGPTFTMKRRCRLRGPLDIRQLQSAFNRLVERHDALRSVVHVGRGVPSQTVYPEGFVELPVFDLTHSAGDEAAIGAFFTEWETRPHNWRRPPLVWPAIARVGPEDHLLSVVVHHTVCDTWSLGILMIELGEQYAAPPTGAHVDLPQQHRFTDYVREQQTLDPDSLRKELEFWRERLEGARATGIAVDEGTSTAERGDKRSYWFDLGPQRADAVIAVARDRRATPFIVLLSAYKLLLYSMTDETDLTIPTLVLGRRRRALEGLVGFLVNALLLRSSLDPGMKLADMVQRVRDVTLEAFAHETPMALVAESVLDVPMLLADEHYLVAPFQYVPDLRDSTRTNLGDGCMVETWRHGAEEVDVDIPGLPLDALVTVRAWEGSMVGTIEYPADAVSSERIRRIALAYCTAIDSIVDQPSATLATAAKEVFRVSDLGLER